MYCICIDCFDDDQGIFGEINAVKVIAPKGLIMLIIMLHSLMFTEWYDIKTCSGIAFLCMLPEQYRAAGVSCLPPHHDQNKQYNDK